MVFASSYHDLMSPEQRPFDYCNGQATSSVPRDPMIAPESTKLSSVETTRVSVKFEPLRNVEGYDPDLPGEYMCNATTATPPLTSVYETVFENPTNWSLFYQNNLGRKYNFAKFTAPGKAMFAC